MNRTRQDDVASAVRPDSLGPVSRALTAASAACFAVLVVFRANMLLGSPLAWGYVLTLGLTVLGAAVGVVELVWRAPADTDGGRRPSGWLRASVAFFVVLVGVLALGGSRAAVGGLSSEGSVFPEHLSLFTIRAFAAFFGALAIGALPLIWARTVTPILHFARSGLALIVPILAAAAFYASTFDLVARPGGWLYLGAYVAVAVAVCIALRVYRPVRAREVASGS